MAPSSKPSLYEQARQEGLLVLRQKLLRLASQILSESGYHALSMRRLAKEAGCSTMVLYNTFGSKEGLVNELYQEGFTLLHNGAKVIPLTSNTEENLLQLCLHYRTIAIENPTHYAIMFEQAIPDLNPSEESRAHGKQSLGPLLRAVSQGIQQGDITHTEAEPFAMMLWASLHGIVTLELANYLPPEEAQHMIQGVIARLLG